MCEVQKLSGQAKMDMLALMLAYPAKPKYPVYAGNVYGFMHSEVDEFESVIDAMNAIEKGKLKYFGKGDFRFFNKAKKMGIWFYEKNLVHVYHNSQWQEFTKTEFGKMQHPSVGGK